MCEGSHNVYQFLIPYPKTPAKQKIVSRRFKRLIEAAIARLAKPKKARAYQQFELFNPPSAGSH